MLQEIRGAVRALDARVAALNSKIDRNYEKHQKRLNGLQLAIQGKSFEDHCRCPLRHAHFSPRKAGGPPPKAEMTLLRTTGLTLSSEPR
jgi:hypothetical protein